MPGPDAKIAAKVRAGAKVNDCFIRNLGATGVAGALLISLGLLCPIHAGHSNMLHTDEHHNGRTEELVAGDFLEIVLAENPTTGYRWHFVETGRPVCVLTQDAYEPKGEGVPGQGGVHRWKFHAAEPGSCKIELAYRRSWEQGPPGRTFRLQVEVRKGVQEKAPAKPTESSRSRPPG